MIHLAPGPTSPPTRSVYLPIVATAPANPVEAFYDLLLHDVRQQRPRLEVCKVLEKAAAWKAADIAAYDYFDHKAHNGEYANATARRLGCVLPAAYDGNWNGIESLGAGSPDALPVFDALMGDDKHRAHLTGETEFFRRQTHMGIACVAGGRYGWVWAIYIAECLT